jgi:peptidoglycan/LPS O-acetylase OafA/YrhL
VVLSHSLPKKWVGMGLLPGDPLLFVDLGRVGVAAFFLISGYVIPFSIPRGGSPVPRFWISRFFRLWPAYWVAILLCLLMEPHQFSRLTVAVNFTMLQRFVGLSDLEGVFWTLQIELVFYVLITLMIVLGLVKNIQAYRNLFYGMIGLSLAMAAARLLLHKTLPVALPMGLTLMFLSGYIRQRKLTGRSFPWAMVALYFSSLVPVCLLGYGLKLRALDDPYRWMIAYALGLVLFLVFERMHDAPSIAVFFGAISYSIYLLHPIAGLVVRRYLPGAGPVLDAIAGLSLAVLAAWVVFRLVELPSQRLGKKIAARVQPSIPVAV